MKLKSFFIIGTLALASVGIASAKSYHISLSNPTMAGGTQLKAGEYDIKVAGGSATLTDDNGKSYKVAVQSVEGSEKFSKTVVNLSKQNGQDTINEIDLGGSSTKLQFGK